MASKYKKIIFTLAIIVLVGIGGFFVLNRYIYNEKQAPSDVSHEPYRTSLAGEYGCLPHRPDAGEQTLECVFGIKTDSGEYYAVDMTLMSQQVAPITPGTRIRASGLVTPVERLSSDHWRKFAIEGIFSITDSLQMEVRAK